MNTIIKDMRDIYRLRGYDFMGYTYRNINDLSFHHIVKECDGGKREISNGAALCRESSHPYLHLIEIREYGIYNAINSILQEIADQNSHPTRDQLIRIRRLLLEYEAYHIDDRNSKGKRLVKKQFIEGRIDL